MTSSALAGVAIGLIQSDLLVHLEIDASKSLHGEVSTFVIHNDITYVYVKQHAKVNFNVS